MATNAFTVWISTSVGLSDSIFSAPTFTETCELVVMRVREPVVLKLPLMAPLIELTFRVFATTPYCDSVTMSSQIDS